MSVTTISPKQLAERCKSGKIDLLDVRTPVEFREVDAAEPHTMPLDRLDPATVMQDRNGKREEPLYLICRSGSRGQQACEKLLAAGFPNVVNVEGGTLAWAECGLPVVRGKKAISLERQGRIAAGARWLSGGLLLLRHSPLPVPSPRLGGAGWVCPRTPTPCSGRALVPRSA